MIKAETRIVAYCDICQEPYEEFGKTVCWLNENDAVTDLETDGWHIDEQTVSHRSCRIAS